MTNNILEIKNILNERYSNQSFTKMELLGIRNSKIAEESLKYLNENEHATMSDVNKNFYMIEQKYK